MKYPKLFMAGVFAFVLAFSLFAYKAFSESKPAEIPAQPVTKTTEPAIKPLADGGVRLSDKDSKDLINLAAAIEIAKQGVEAANARLQNTQLQFQLKFNDLCVANKKDYKQSKADLAGPGLVDIIPMSSDEIKAAEAAKAAAEGGKQ